MDKLTPPEVARGYTTAANMRNYKPRRPGVTLNDVVTPEERAKRAAMRAGVQDEAMQGAVDSAYERARTTPARYAKGGSVSSTSKRADGCAQRGKTKGRML